MKYNIYILIGLIWFLLFPVSVATPQVFQQVTISSTPNPLGSGARAIGMGSAFIAVADDATASMWNPGGLMQLETPELSIVLYDAIRTENYYFFSHPESDGSERTNEFNLNYFSAAYPFALFGKNMIVSLNYQRLYDIDKELEYNSQISLNGGFLDISQKLHYKAEGGIKALSPAYAIQITEDLSFGFTLNFWLDALGGRNGWKDELRWQRIGTLGGEPMNETFVRTNEYDNTRGFNYNLGILWNITEIITLGAVFKSEFESRMRHSIAQQRLEEFPLLDRRRTNSFADEETMKLNFPLSYGAGLSFRFSDELTMAFDVFRTEWGRYFFLDEDDRKTSPIDGRPINPTSNEIREGLEGSHINATTQVHLGAEYLFILEKMIIPVRGGVFYDPEPSEDLSEDFYGFSLGTGVSIGDVIIDAAYQYRWGIDSENRGVEGAEADVAHHTFYLSAIYHF